MTYYIKRSQLDIDSLDKAPRISHGIANTFDYSNVVVNKPWGNEFLYRQSEKFGIWILNIDANKATSLHCHENKRTALVVAYGSVVCSTLSGEYGLMQGDAIVFDAGVFHSTRALKDDASIIEVETPPLKGDLVRLRDNFGRVKESYELPEKRKFIPIPSPKDIEYIDLAINLVNEN